jgi:hypothetical protein
VSRNPEQRAAELLEGAAGRYDGVRPVVLRFAELCAEIETLYARIMEGGDVTLPLLRQAAEITAEYSDIVEFLLFDPGPRRLQ